MEYPFEQIEKEGKLVRTFSPDVDSDELKWHQDLMDRKVTIIESGGWSFQMDDGLPNKLSNAEQILIPIHRVIRPENHHRLLLLRSFYGLLGRFAGLVHQRRNTFNCRNRRILKIKNPPIGGLFF